MTMNSEVYNVIIIGNVGVGKSTIVNTLKNIYQKIDIPENNSNCTTLYILKNCFEYVINIVEINENIYENGEIIWSKIPNSINGVIICYDVTNKSSLTDITDVLAAFSKNSLSTFLVGCKANSNEKKREIKRKAGVKIAQIFNVPFIEINITAIEEQVKMFFEVFLEMIIKNKVVIESKQSNTMHQIYNPLEILKNENNYNAKLQFDSDVVMYPIANFYRLSIDDDSEIEYTTNNSSSSSVVNSNITSSSINQDDDTVEIVDDVQIRSREIPDITVENEEQDEIKKKTFMNMKMRSLKIPKGSNFHGFDILDLGNDEMHEDDITENYKNTSLQSIKTTENDYSVNKLIERMTSEGTQEIEFTKIFLIFYRKFLRPSELLDLLMDRFEQYENSDNKNNNTINIVQLRVCNVLIHWVSEYWSDFHNPKMRFTLQVFLDVCSCRPAFSIVCSKLENLIYRQPAIIGENDITWGIPDIDDDSATVDTNKSTNTSSNTITSANLNGNSSFNSVNTNVTAKPNNLNQSNRNSLNVPDNSNTNEVISITEALRMTNIPNNGTSSSGNQASNINNNPPNSKGNTQNNETSSLNSSNKSNNLSLNEGIIRKRGNSHSHSAHSSIDSKKGNSSLPLFNNEQVSVSSAVSMSLTQPSEFILNQDNTMIAQQLCLIEFEIFRRIKPRDLLQHIWGKRDKNSVASSSVAASIEHFNFISSWVTTQILEHKKAKHRAKVLGKFMKIAQHLRNYNNYNTLMAFIAGINCASIQRMRQTKQILENRTCSRQYKELETLMNSERSFSAYRLALKQSELPCVPYLGVFLRDLLYIDEANKGVKKDENGNDVININKYLLMGDIIMMIKNFQLRPYPFQININIINAINYTPILSDEDAYKDRKSVV